jgi:glycosyltransferase involved in cell wall biosynthesis
VMPKDAEAMAAGLQVLASNPGLRRLVGGTNRARAEREYDQEKSLATWAALLDDMSDLRGATPSGRSRL